MALINENYLKLKGSYLFSEIAKRVDAFSKANTDKKIIRLGIGDVTQPLPDACIQAMHKAVDELSKKETFKGYGPERGYGFLIDKIIKNDYLARGIQLDEDEVFISDGAKSDTGNIVDIFGINNIVAVTDPVYPVYVDTNIMSGRSGAMGNDGRWSDILYLPCTIENNFTPSLPDKRVDMLYLCFPNNPTGTTITKDELKKWVDYARENDTVILYDAAYEAYISEDNVAHSIYEIEGAKDVAIEFRSFSKNAGFTGTRCAFSVVPKQLCACTQIGEKVSLNNLWNRRQSTKFNGAPYIIQRGAEAVYTDEGKAQIKETISYYMENAKIIRAGLKEAGLSVFGGINAPYIWLKTPDGYTSWSFFDKLLKDANVVGTPGEGFGPSGEGYFRLTAFGDRQSTVDAVSRIKNVKF